MSAALARYEGCGAEGPVRCIFLAEFHNVDGPKIRCQVPPDILPKDAFDAVSAYIIPKQQLERRTLTVNVLGYKISGYPIILEGYKKYQRNHLIFNLCFVCHPWSRTVQYEPALKKLAEYLVELEQDDGFVSHADQNACALERMLETVLADINAAPATSTVTVSAHALQLKVTHFAADPPLVHDYNVPLLVIAAPDRAAAVDHGSDSRWDLTTQQILPFITGVHHVARIAADADVEMNLVKAAVQNLVYHRVVRLLPIFQYSNVYAVTPRLAALRDCKAFRKEFLDHVALCPPSDAPVRDRTIAFRDVLAFIAGFGHATNVGDLCSRMNPRRCIGVDEVRLVQFLTLHGILRRVHKYPVYVQDPNQLQQAAVTSSSDAATVTGGGGVRSSGGRASYAGGCGGGGAPHHPSAAGGGGGDASLVEWFNGQRHFDEICCATGLASAQLEERVENHPNVIVLHK